MDKITMKKLNPDERETLLNYDYLNKKWLSETLISKHYNRFVRQGWTQTKMYVNEDGVAIGGCFEAPARAITIRGAAKKKMSQKQMQNLEDDDTDTDEDENE